MNKQIDAQALVIGAKRKAATNRELPLLTVIVTVVQSVLFHSGNLGPLLWILTLVRIGWLF